jgi:hypothetical protein
MSLAWMPTQPWSEVKVATPPQDTKADTDSGNSTDEIISNDLCDKYIAQAIALVNDAQSWITWVDYHILSQPGGYENGFPAGAYAVVKDAGKLADRLLEISVKDRERQSVLFLVLEDLLRSGKQLDMYGGVIRLAGASGGFTNRVQDELNEANGIPKEKRTAPIDRKAIATVFRSEVFQKGLSEDILVAIRAKVDEAGFEMGSAILSNRPTTLFYIFRDTVAWKLGFKDGDVVQVVDGKAIQSLQEFKAILKASVGKKIKLTIVRNGMRQEIERKISPVWEKK